MPWSLLQLADSGDDKSVATEASVISVDGKNVLVKLQSKPDAAKEEEKNTDSEKDAAAATDAETKAGEPKNEN